MDKFNKIFGVWAGVVALVALFWVGFVVWAGIEIVTWLVAR